MGRSKTYLFLDYRWGADTRCWSWQSIVLSGRCWRVIHPISVMWTYLPSVTATTPLCIAAMVWLGTRSSPQKISKDWPRVAGTNASAATSWASTLPSEKSEEENANQSQNNLSQYDSGNVFGTRSGCRAEFRRGQRLSGSQG